jgi:signal transduction histidine kinase
MLLSTLQREVSDTRLHSAAIALQTIVAHVGSGDERTSVVALSQSGLNGAIFDAGGRLASASTIVPEAVRAAAVAHAGETTIAKGVDGSSHLRMLIFPLAAAGRPQSAVFWRTVDTFADVDLLSAVIFMFLTPMIVLLAFVASDRFTRRALAPLDAVTVMAATIEATDLGKRIAPQHGTTELANLCGTLNRMFARLDSAFGRQRRFTADASHELRTPLSVIMAEADLGSQGLTNESEYRRSMSVILREAHTIEALTSELLALARVEAGLTKSPAPVDVYEIAADAIERLAGLARMRHIEVALHASGRPAILGDRDAIARVPLSLLHNALRFSNEGSRIDISVDAAGDTARLVVEDEGPGFTAEGLERAFERFWRGDASRQGGGSGLGLAIVHSLVQSAHGSIEIANRPARGCRVVVEFPALPSTAPANARKAPQGLESVN